MPLRPVVHDLCAQTANNGTMNKIAVAPGTTVVVLNLNPAIVVESWYEHSFCLHRRASRGSAKPRRLWRARQVVFSSPWHTRTLHTLAHAHTHVCTCSVGCCGALCCGPLLPVHHARGARYGTTASVVRGPLLFSLNIPGNYTVLASYAFESKDYQVLPLGEWRYALEISDPTNPAKDFTFVRNPFPEGALGWWWLPGKAALLLLLLLLLALWAGGGPELPARGTRCFVCLGVFGLGQGRRLSTAPAGLCTSTPPPALCPTGRCWTTRRASRRRPLRALPRARAGRLCPSRWCPTAVPVCASAHSLWRSPVCCLRCLCILVWVP
jgi:hypothetical protein